MVTSFIMPASWLSSCSVVMAYVGPMCPMCREHVLPAPLPADQWRANLLEMTEAAGANARAIIGDEL